MRSRTLPPPFQTAWVQGEGSPVWFGPHMLTAHLTEKGWVYRWRGRGKCQPDDWVLSWVETVTVEMETAP